MRSFRVPVLAVAAFAIACGAADNPDVAAKVGSEQLSSARLADILGNSQAPLERDVARSIAELWVNYQLLGQAAAKGDSLNDKKTMDDALWSNIENMKVKKFYDTYQKTWDTVTYGTDEERYNKGEKLGARHILVKVDPTATPEQRQAARRKAEQIRAEATPANFKDLAAKRTEEPGGGERGGMLPLFGSGEMVAAFDAGVRAIKPGEISPLVETEYGYHIIYRLPFNEVKTEFSTEVQKRNSQIADSVYLANTEKNAQVKLETDAAITAKAIARNPLGYTKDNGAVAKYKGGELTKAEFADWLQAYPPNMQVRPQIINAPDSLVGRFILQIVRNELMLRAADSTKMVTDTAEMSNLYLNFKNAVTQAWTGLGVAPNILADSAKGDSKEKAAAARVETYFDKLVKNEVQFVDIAYPVARALQRKYPYSVNDAGLDKAVDKAKAVRAAADSLKAKQPPVQPGADAPPAVTPPVVAPPTGTPPAGTPPGTP
jgi:peptidyl-prolyl cis-trans isomerase D